MAGLNTVSTPNIFIPLLKHTIMLCSYGVFDLIVPLRHLSPSLSVCMYPFLAPQFSILSSPLFFPPLPYLPVLQQFPPFLLSTSFTSFPHSSLHSLIVVPLLLLLFSLLLSYINFSPFPLSSSITFFPILPSLFLPKSPSSISHHFSLIPSAPPPSLPSPYSLIPLGPSFPPSSPSVSSSHSSSFSPNK